MVTLTECQGSNDVRVQFTAPHLQAFLEAYQDAVDSVHEDGVVTINEVQYNPPWALDRIDQTDLPLDMQYHFYNQATSVNIYVVDTVWPGAGSPVSGLLMLSHQNVAPDCFCICDQ